jgi:hypothetical protein
MEIPGDSPVNTQNAHARPLTMLLAKNTTSAESASR